MPAPTYIALPYHFARTPLTVIDLTLVQRLPERSPLRRTFDTLFGTLDLVAGRLLDDQSLLRQGVERTQAAAKANRPSARETVEHDDDQAEPTMSATESTAPAKPSAASKPAAAERPATRQRPAPAKQARADVVERRQHKDSRANQSLATIRQNLAQTEAIAEAHEHQAEERVADETDES